MMLDLNQLKAICLIENNWCPQNYLRGYSLEYFQVYFCFIA
jgi:hypothetical protein